MKFLLDTCTVSESRTSRANPGVTTWLAQIAPHDLAISVITLLELEIGVQRVERRDLRQGKLLRSWLESRVRPGFEGRVLHVDPDIALRTAAMHVPDPAPFRDSLIAATALIHGMTVVTRNTRDFEPTGASVLNPWD